MLPKKQITKTGQRLTITYEDKEFDVMVINPHGLGRNQPTVGFGFNMAQKYIGLPKQTLSDWSTKESGFEGDLNLSQKSLKLPSGRCLRLSEVLGLDNHRYVVIEANDWMELVADVLKNPGQLRKKTQDKLTNFLCWFAGKGFYAEAYTALKGTCSKEDSEAISRWLNKSN